MRRTLSASAETLVGSRWPWSWLPHAFTVCPCTGSRRGFTRARPSARGAGRARPPAPARHPSARGLAEHTLPAENGAAHASLLADELDNLRVALRWAANEQQTELGRRLAIVTGRLLLSLGTSALWRGDLPSAQARLDEAAERLHRVDNPAELVSAAVHLRALIAARSGTGPAALRVIDQPLDRERRLADLPRLIQTPP